jgi:hypothetical protein
MDSETIRGLISAEVLAYTTVRMKQYLDGYHNVARNLFVVLTVVIIG